MNVTSMKKVDNHTSVKQRQLHGLTVLYSFVVLLSRPFQWSGYNYNHVETKWLLIY